MSDMYLAENPEGDLTVWLVMPDGEDRAILDRSDLNIGRPLILNRLGEQARANAAAVTAAHDELWRAATANLLNRDQYACVARDDLRSIAGDLYYLGADNLRFTADPDWVLVKIDPNTFTDREGVVV